MTNSKTTLVQTIFASFAVGALLLGLSACAPEPSDAAGSVDKETQTTSPETEWGGQDVPEEDLQTTLPASFPKDLFALPSGAKIYNTGERGSEQWYLVLEAADAAAAAALWEEIIARNEFSVSDEVETTEGGAAAVLTTNVLTVQALTIPQANGSVLVNYDLVRMS